ncbi:hypothetical protein [Amycolatopsis samaneae]|uniref:HEAT repeat domain-containing protein n=1 Tax=Amycolatopsis samaneae TaxID=664691 RepID=A0ABW5GNX9_9PSEU
MAGLFDPDPEYDAKSMQEIIDIAFNESTSPSYRLAAVINLGRRGRESPNPNLVRVLEEIASSGEFQEVRFLHGPSLSYVAVAGLIYWGTNESINAARRAIGTLDKDDVADLTWFLKSGHFTLPDND